MFWHRDLTSWLWLLLSMDYEVIDTLGLVFSAYLDDLQYLPIFHFILKHSTCDIFILISILPKSDHFLPSHTSHCDTWPHTPLSIRRRCRSILDFFDCTFIIFWTLGSTSSMIARPDILLIYWWWCFHFDIWHAECWFTCSLHFEH